MAKGNGETGMRLEQLHYLVTIAEYMSFSKAGNRLFLSPQALSRSMAALEKELGITLFIRLSTGVQFTKEGDLIVSMARKMLKEYDDTMEMIANRNKDTHQKIYLYTFGVFVEAYINHLALKFRSWQSASEIKIAIKELNHKAWEDIGKNQQKNWVIFLPYLEGMENVPLINSILENTILTTDEALSSKHVVCVSQDSVLAQQKEISLKMLSSMPYVRFSSDLDDEDRSAKRDILDIYYKDNPISPAYTVNNLVSWIEAIASGVGVGLIDGLLYKSPSKSKDLFEKVKVLSVTEPIKIQHGFATDADCPSEITAFVQFAINELKNMLR